MASLVWDKVGERTYESGLDRGVLYLPDGSAVPWNGLTSVVEKFDKEITPVYYDGMKISQLVALGDFSATMKAFTFPDEFLELQGQGKLKPGFMAGDQPPQAFGLSYRNKIGNDVAGDNAGYKIHILYNLIALPADRTYETLNDASNLTEFEWDLSSVPEEVLGFHPTAHFVIDTNDINPLLFPQLESILYGDSTTNPSLIPLADLVAYVENWALIKITDNGDGTWTATEQKAGYITFPSDPTLFQITNVTGTFTDASTYVISDTEG